MPLRFVFRQYTLCLIAVFLISLIGAKGAPGDLDSSFSTDGLTAQIDFGETYDEVGAVMEDANGRIVMAGTSADSVVLARYLADGTLDLAFGTDGILTTRAGLDDGDFDVTSVMQAPDGRYFVSGTYYYATSVETSDAQVFVMAFTNEGELDTIGFGSETGVVLLNPAGTRDDIGVDADIQIVGNEWYILVVNQMTTSDFTQVTQVAQLDPVGTESLYFGGSGTVTWSSVDSGRINDLVIDSDGKFFLVGHEVVDEVQFIQIMKYESYGYGDYNFGDSGVFTDVNLEPIADEFGVAAALDADGSLLVLYQAGETVGVRKYSRFGVRDVDFGAGGETLVPFPFTLTAGVEVYLTASNIQVRQDTGKILVAASADTYGQTQGSESYQPFFFQMKCDGSADASFGTSGALTYDVGASFYGQMKDMVLDSNNRPVFGYTSDEDLLVGRLEADAVDSLFTAFSEVYFLHETRSGSTANNDGVTPPSLYVFDVGFNYATAGHIISASITLQGESAHALTMESSDATGETWSYSFSSTDESGLLADYPRAGLYTLSIVFDNTTYTQLPATYNIVMDTFEVGMPIETPFTQPYDGETGVSVTNGLSWSPPYGGSGSTNYVEYQLTDLDNQAIPVEGQLYDPESRTTYQIPTSLESLTSHLFYLMFVRLEPKRDPASCIVFNIGRGVSTESLFVTGIAPVNAVDDTYSVSRNGTLSIDAPGVMANDTEDGTGTVEVLDDVTHGTLTMTTDGGFIYEPTTDYLGSDSFTYTLTQDDETNDTATVTITVINNAPVGVADGPFTLVHDTTTTGDDTSLLDNDTDADGDTLTASLVTDVSNGTLTLDSSGTFSYTPDEGFAGSDSFVYKAYDGVDYSNEVTVDLTVTNEAPAASDDSYSVLHDQILTVTTPTVLDNDTDDDGDSLTATLATDVSNGTLALNSNGTFTYTPDAGFTGDDSFTYTATDGIATTAEATVTISVTNNAPSATDDSYSVLHDQVLTVAVGTGVLVNDTDGDGETIRATLVDDVSNGTLALTLYGSFTYTPDAGFVGDDTFTYKAGDGAAFSSTTTVTISVTNAAPSATADTYSIVHDGTLTVNAAAGVLANDTDADGDAMSATLVATTTDGTLSLSSDGSFTYKPDEGFVGDDTFTYKAGDGLASSSTTTVTISVTNATPSATADTYSIVHDGTLTVNAAAGILANDTDDDGDTITVTLVDDVANGTLALSSDGSFTYTPDEGFVGDDTFTYKAGDGLASSSTTTVTISATNAAPSATADTYNVLHDGTLTVNAAAGILANDTDDDGDTITATVVATTENGTLTPLSDGSFTYEPDANFVGDDTFTYKAYDGFSYSSTVSVTISVTNQNPAGTNDSYSVHHGTTLSVVVAEGVLANDTDADDDTLTATVLGDVSHGTLSLSADGSFTYTPTTGYVGADGFTYTVTDGPGSDTPVNVSLTITNTAPVVTDDSYSVLHDTTLTKAAPAGVLANDTDEDGDTLNVTLVDDVTNGTLSLNANGSFTYTPDAGFVGSDSFTYTLNDGAEDAALEGTVSITVDNGTPTAVADTYSVAHGETLTVSATSILDNDTDSDGDTLTATLKTDVSDGTLALNSDGTFTYTPDTTFAGEDSFTYVANDGANDSDPVTVTITVTNTDPVAVDDTYSIHQGNTLTVIDTDGVLANDSDDDSDPLTVAVLTDVSHGSLSLGTDGSFVYTPEAGYVGEDTFEYTLSDAFGGSHTATATITVENTVPETTADSYSIPHDTTLDNTGEGGESVLANDTDGDEDTINAVLVTTTTNGTLNLNSDGTFTYTPDTGFVGTDTFYYVANDGAESSTPAQEVSITVTNNVPTIADTSFTVYLNTPFTLDAPGLLTDVTDDESDDLIVVLDEAPTSGDSFELNADGSFSFDPGADFEGDYFTFHIEDGLGSSDFIVVTLTLGNLAPVANDDTYTVAHNATLTASVPALGVIANDTDNEGDTLTATLDADVLHGTLSLNGDGTFTYSPEGDYVGDDTFTYYVSDGTSDSESATVTITVTNGAPEGTDDEYTVSRNGVLSELAPGVLANDSDPDGSPLEATLVTAPTNGTVTLNPDGSFVYYPNLDFSGSDSFEYQVSDPFTDAATINTVTLTITQKTFFVTPTTTGTVDGLSWSTAFNSLHDALSEAQQGDEIWISAGTYLTSDSDTQYDYFEIPYGVSIFGGFAGTEASITERDIRANPTILSGQIGDPDSFEDNAYHVLMSEFVEFDGEIPSIYNPNWPAFVLDGLMIEGGNAFDDEGYDNGGGLVAWAPGGEVWNCTFSYNFATYGGAVWDTSYGGTKFYNTQFHHNAAFASGGAIYNESYESPAVVNCSFAENQAGSEGPNSGGSIYNDTEYAYPVSNSIVWGNGPEPLYGYFDVNYSDVEGIFSESELGGTGNIEMDPLFYDAENGDLRLPPTSPCIDAANSSIGTSKDGLEMSRVDVPSIANTGAGTPAFSDMGALETNHRIWVTINLKNGWNLVSYPYATTSTVPELLGSEVLAAYKWDGAIQDYVDITTPTPELGIFLYWDGASTTINKPSPTFTEPTTVTRNLVFRWNIIAATTTTTVPSSAKSVIIHRFNAEIQDYEQVGTGNGTGETLVPGIGYWLFSSEANTSTF